MLSVDELPELPERGSKLKPHLETILTLRRKRYTYRQIAEFLFEHCAVKVNQSTIFDFVKRQRKIATAANGPAAIAPAERPQTHDSVASTEQPSRWNFDVDKPRTIQKH